MLEIEGINAGYGKLHVLFDITTQVEEKQIKVLVGPNGSGKSTLLKTLLGLTNVYSGKAHFEGTSILGLLPHEIAKLGIAYLPQVNSVFANLKVTENLSMSGYILGKREAQERVSEVLEHFPVLNNFLSRKAGSLSGGERQMLAMAMAMMRRPKIMLFDEPTGSLAPKIALEVLDKILNLREEHGMTIMLAEQNARKALECGDKAILLVGGRITYDGGAQELLEHPELGQVYLGLKKA